MPLYRFRFDVHHRAGLQFSAGLALAALVQLSAAAQTARDPLDTLSGSVERLVRKVAPSVVQVMVTGYGPVEDGQTGSSGIVIGRQRAVGSGAIISADGFIVTNAHVVAGAQRVEVLLHGPAGADQLSQFLMRNNERRVQARVVGVAREIDLALLKIDATGLVPIPLADYENIHQGEVVFAFGSPEGLRNSVTMGVVSAVARQPDPDSPTLFIQTDAPINPGNSGGPLVNTDGELVGVNTFILSESGGSQGLGFAIPSAVVAKAYPDLKQYGRLHRGVIGIDVQAISPEIARGLHLAREEGVLVSDVLPDSPAASLGIEPQDIVTAIDGKPTPTIAVFGLLMMPHRPGDTVKLDLLRGTDAVTVNVPVIEEPRTLDRLEDLADPTNNAVPQLGIIGVDITEETADLIPGLRIPSGVLVAAREERSDRTSNPLTSGDIIHAVNGYTVRSLDGLRVILEGMKSRSRVVLQIERDHRLKFVTTRVE